METETRTAHTSGPWIWRKKGLESKSGTPIRIMSPQVKSTFTIAKATARLIATSPELLEALTLCLEVLDQVFDGHEKPQGCREIARKVIAKATP